MLLKKEVKVYSQIDAKLLDGAYARAHVKAYEVET